MDLQFWIWLIIVVASLVARALKKTSKSPNSPAEEPYTESDTSDHKPMTFEELLREIQASKTPPAPVKQKKSYEVDYDEEIEEETKGLETIPSNDNRSYEIYENAKKQAFSRPSLEETLKLEDTIVKYDHFKSYDDAPKNTFASDVLNDFKDPEGFKRAFIMSEILKPKF